MGFFKDMGKQGRHAYVVTTVKDATPAQILEALSHDEDLCKDVIDYLNYGCRDEWDCDLGTGVEILGGRELAIAAKSGMILAQHHENSPND